MSFIVEKIVLNSKSNSYFDVIVLGGGAAGLMCAFTAGNHGKSVLVLECANKLGKKILMSGGGRCNFTNLDIQMDNFLSSNPHFFKSALKQYTQWDFISLVAKHGIDYHEKELGQLFCDDSSKQIVSMLKQECDDAGVECRLECEVTSVAKGESQTKGQYELTSNHGDFQCNSLVIATGGLSIPSLGGATGFGYQLAEQFGLPVKERIASLVPMTLTGRWHELSKALSGVALPVVVSVENRSFSSDMLFTHRGISGPAILQLSNYWRLGEEVTVDLLPSLDFDELYQRLLKTKQSNPNLLLKTYLNNYFPKSFVQVFLQDYLSVQGKHKDSDVLQLFKKDELKGIAKHFKYWSIKPSGTEGYRTAEVTLGGVDVDYLSSKTMEVNDHKGLFFIGETVDVTAHLGGYNFQWAWSSGYVAGLNV